jgi:hypothetical protein
VIHHKATCPRACFPWQWCLHRLCVSLLPIKPVRAFVSPQLFVASWKADQTSAENDTHSWLGGDDVVSESITPEEEAPVICATALNVTSFTGRCALVIRSAPHMAAEALCALRGMHQFYRYVVFCVFWTLPVRGLDETGSIPNSVQPAFAFTSPFSIFICLCVAQIRTTLGFLHASVLGEDRTDLEGGDEMLAEVLHCAGA